MSTHIFPHPSGVEWYNAPVPRRFHRCKPWTVASDNGLSVRRCACGAIRLGNYGPWLDRNSRRKDGDR